MKGRVLSIVNQNAQKKKDLQINYQKWSLSRTVNPL